jgi:hypothetical protein
MRFVEDSSADLHKFIHLFVFSGLQNGHHGCVVSGDYYG